MSHNNALLEHCATAPSLYPALQSATQQIVGHKLFTLMAIDYTASQAARIYTSHPVEYPVGGRKPLGDLTNWGKVVIGKAKPWIGYDADDMEWAFFDHAIIAGLDCASCLNLPVVDAEAKGGPRVIGTMNLLHGAGHYRPEHIAQLEPFARLLLQPYRDWANARD